MKKKTILLIIIIALLIVSAFDSGYDNIEEKIIDDTNTGSSINAEMTADLFIVDEYSKDFYVCVGETEAGRVCVLSIEYKPSGFRHARKQKISDDKLFNVEKRVLTVNKKDITYGFVENPTDSSIKIDGKNIDLLTFNFEINNKEKEVGFWYYVSE